jgi:serine protease Do
MNRNQNINIMKKAVIYFSFALAGGFMAVGLSTFFPKPTTSEFVQPNIPPSQIVSVKIPNNLIDFTVAAERSINAVVHVKTEYTPKEYYNPLYEMFYGRGQGPPAKSAGSGVLVSDNGYIVTNNHVIENAAKIEITLNNTKTYVAELIGRDPLTDLALLKIEEENLPFLVYGNSDKVKVGQWALAVGNPFNLTSTVTAGIISAKARNINLLDYDPVNQVFPIESFIQTDAAVNPGNSGGALVSPNGELIGINTAIASRTGSYAGYSFAVPVNIVKKVISDLHEFGSVQRAYIGIGISNIEQSVAKELKLESLSGVLVTSLTPKGAAYEAGIKSGDIITSVGGQDVQNVTELQEQVGRFRPGDKVSIGVKRNGTIELLDVELRNKQGTTQLNNNPINKKMSVLGAQMISAPTDILKQLDIKHGVQIIELDQSQLKRIGVREGFIITEIGPQAIKEPEDVKELLSGKKGGVLITGVYPNGMKTYYGLGL